MLSEKLLSVAILGIDPILWLLIAMSFIGIGVMIERGFIFNYAQKHYQEMNEYELKAALEF